MKNKIEILSPAGSYDSLKAAIAAGADAVYVGGTRFGARAFADNFDTETMLEAIDYVHLHGKKIYLTVNTLLKEHELKRELYDYLLPYYKQGIDAVIVQDIGVLQFVREQFPDLPIHASTQMTITNVRGAKFLERLGVERVVTAREMKLDEIREIAEQTDLEIESFVHGALCYCYSGQCLYSSMLGGRSGNRGQCAQPCRLPYRMKGTSKAQYLLSLKDICTLEYIPELVESGIFSFKIEGRMKKPEYVAFVTAMYRKYVDLYLKVGKRGFSVEKKDKENLMDIYNRGGFHSGYYHTQNGREMLSMNRPNHAGVAVLQVIKCTGTQIYAKVINEIHKGDVIELPYENENYTFAENFRIGQKVSFTSYKPQKLESNSILHRVRNESLLREIHENIICKGEKEKISGRLELCVGKEAKLTLTYCDVTINVIGAVVEQALKQPMDVERIEKQMRKTGNTEFEFSVLDIYLDGDVFIPMQGLNELRRQGIEELKQQVLCSYRRSVNRRPQRKAEREVQTSVRRAVGLFVYVEELDQFEAVIASQAVQRIYVDANAVYHTDVKQIVNRSRAEKKEIYLAMPHIFRRDICMRYEANYDAWIGEAWDGMLIRNMESYEFLTEHDYKGKIVADYNLYQFNRYAKEFYLKHNLESTTAALELNCKELQEVGLEESELIVYGYYPMMISAQCIQKTTEGCHGRRGQLSFVDRYHKTFTVKNQCDSCYNVIYNTSPVSLIDQKSEIDTLAPKALRLHFTIEDSEQVRDILRMYDEVFLKQLPLAEIPFEFTRGHFKRGIK